MMSRSNQEFWMLMDDIQVTLVNCNLTPDQIRMLDTSLQELLPQVRDEKLAAVLRNFLTVNTVRDGLSPDEIEELAGIIDAIAGTEGTLVGLDAL